MTIYHKQKETKIVSYSWIRCYIRLFVRMKDTKQFWHLDKCWHSVSMTARALIIRSVSSFTLAEAWWALQNLDGPLLVLLFFITYGWGCRMCFESTLTTIESYFVFFFTCSRRIDSVGAHTINIEMQNNHAHLEIYMRNDLNVWCDLSIVFERCFCSH